jgi:putative ABC transport system substrate-binding protein
LHNLVPQAQRVGIFYNPNYPANKSGLDALRQKASVLGATLVEVPVLNAAALQADLQARAQLPDIGIDAILITTDDVTQSPDGWPILSKFAADHRLPIAGSAAFEADSGALFTYIPDTIETGKLAAPLADKVLKGATPGTIPVVSPESILRLNYKQAQILGLTVPDGLLRQAAEVIH